MKISQLLLVKLVSHISGAIPKRWLLLKGGTFVCCLARLQSDHPSNANLITLILVTSLETF